MAQIGMKYGRDLVQTSMARYMPGKYPHRRLPPVLRASYVAVAVAVAPGAAVVVNVCAV
jgi:hypothetical protein